MEIAIPHVAHENRSQFYPIGMKDWGNRFRAHMKLHKLSQEGLGEALGRSQGAVGHWLRGERQINLAEFWALCEAAGADPKLILFGEGGTGLVSEIRQALTAHPELIPGYRRFENKLKRRKVVRTRSKARQ